MKGRSGGAVKGGSAIKLRLGDASTRYAIDLDVALVTGLDEFLEGLKSNLREGWEEPYARQAEGLDVLPTVGGAAAWSNDLIAKIAPAWR